MEKVQKDKALVDKFVQELFDVMIDSEGIISYHFDSSNHSRDGSYFICDKNKCKIVVYFSSIDNYEKWVDVFIKAESEIDTMINIRNHNLNAPTDFEYIKNNLEYKENKNKP